MTATLHPPHPQPRARAREVTVGTRVVATGVERFVGRHRLLHPITLTVEPGELVAIAGGTGAGKSTLLETLAGVQRASAGSVILDPHCDADGNRDDSAVRVGYVPQDDIVHRHLPLRRALRYAAQLQLPATTSGEMVDRIIDETLQDLDLTEQADVVVASLSGGQRKRASIAVELLTRPGVFFLDEPTSGLDPATSADVMTLLRRLADRGVTVVLTTHHPADLDACDRVVLLARGGHLAFAGTPSEVRSRYRISELSQVYRLLRPVTEPPTVEPLAEAVAATRGGAASGTAAGSVRQWWVLTRRNVDTMTRNRLTMTVMVGSPALVTSMMAVLFRPGTFEQPGSLAPVQTMFWIAFAAFFFGLTYGLLQIVGEMPIVRRERRTGLSAGPYVVSKVTVLLPVLALVSAGMLGVLRLLDRLPTRDTSMWLMLLGAMVAVSACALSLGLLASAVVPDATQATLVLPMLCFPQVLFAGAVVPLSEMAAPGRIISAAMATRWGFESLGRSARLGGPADAPASAYGDAFIGSAWQGVIVVGALALALGAATVLAVALRTRRR